VPDIVYAFRQTGARSIESAFQRIDRAALANEASVNKALSTMEAYGAAVGKIPRGGLPRIGVGAPGTSGGPRRAPARAGAASPEVASAQREAAEKARIRRREESDEERSYQRRRAMAERFYNERLRSAVRAAQRQGRTAGQIASRTGGSAFSMPSGYDLANGALGVMGRGLTTGALAAGAALVGVGGLATRDAVRLQEASNRISINARGSGQGFVDPTELRREFENTAIATPGIKGADVAEAVQGFVTKTGELGVGRKLQRTFATTASATGADIRDVSSAGADLFQKFGIRSEKEMQEALAALTFQGKSGAFELADIGSKFAKIGSAGARFGVDKGLQGVKTMGGLSQIAMSATGDRDTAATAVEATLRQLIAQSGALKKQGVNVFDQKTGATRDLPSVLAETIAKVGGGDMEKKAVGLQKIFGDEGIRGISPLIAAFGEGAKGAAGKDGKTATEAERMAAGLARVRAELDKAINAPGTWADVQKDAAQAQKDTSARMDAAWAKVVSIAGEKIVPELTKLVESLAGTPELFTALQVTIGGLIDMLKALGILSETPKETPQEAVEREKKALAATQTELAALPQDLLSMTPEQRDQWSTLRAKEKIQQEKVAKAEALASATTGPKTTEELAASYANAGPQLPPEQAAARREAITQAATAAGPFGAFVQTEGENVDQGRIRGEMAARQQAAMGNGGAVVNDAGSTIKTLQAALQALIGDVNNAKTAAGQAATAMRNVGGPSI
jgi:hypothetical protein